MQESFEGKFDPDTKKNSALKKVCSFRRAVRASCFQKIIDNYCLLLKLCNEYLTESLDAEIRSRIIGCKAQMKTFNFFFGLCFGQRYYSLRDNLSKTLQMEKMLAVSGKRLTCLTAKTFQSMINDSGFNLFYQTVSKKQKN